MLDKLPAIPAVPLNSDPAQLQFNAAVKLALDMIANGQTSAVVTKEQLQQSAQTVKTQVVTEITNAGAQEPPRALDNLTVTAGPLYNFLEWGTNPGNAQLIEVWRNSSDSRENATLIATSRLRMYIDYIPEGVGNDYYYWIRGVASDGTKGDWNLVDGKISAAGTKAAPIGIGDSQVGRISANKIVCLELSALSANLGTVTAGLMQSPDGTFVIDLVNKRIIIAGPNGHDNDDYTILQNGQVSVFRHTGGGQHQQAQALQTIETGDADNGALVQLQRWYDKAPAIMVVPKSLDLYLPAFSAQTQRLENYADEVSLSPSGVVTFRPVSRLALSSNTSTVVVNNSSGSTNADTWSQVYTSAANTNRIWVNVQFASQRGTGTSPLYFARNVSFRLGWRPSGSGSGYAYTPYVSHSFADFLIYNGFALDSGPITSNTYEFIVEFVAQDAGSTFENGAGGFEYTQQTISPVSDSAYVDTTRTTNDITLDVPMTWPSYAVPVGYSVYSVDYNINFRYALYAVAENVLFSSKKSSAFIYTKEGGLARGISGSYPFNSDSGNSSVAFSSANYDAGAVTTLRVRGAGSSGANASAAAQILASGTTATIKSRKQIANSTTPVNNFTITSYINYLSGSSILANGKVTYLAIG